jgi:hypothetical protein
LQALGKFIDGLQVVVVAGGGDIKKNLHTLSDAKRSQDRAKRNRRASLLVVVGLPVPPRGNHTCSNTVAAQQADNAAADNDADDLLGSGLA